MGKAGSFGGDALEDVVKAKCAQQRLETAATLRNVRGQQPQALATRLPEQRLRIRSFYANEELLLAKGSGNYDKQTIGPSIVTSIAKHRQNLFL